MPDEEDSGTERGGTSIPIVHVQDRGKGGKETYIIVCIGLNMFYSKEKDWVWLKA